MEELRLVLSRIARGEVDEVTDRDEDGVAQAGFTRPLTREEMMRMAQDAIRTFRRHPVEVNDTRASIRLHRTDRQEGEDAGP